MRAVVGRIVLFDRDSEWETWSTGVGGMGGATNGVAEGECEVTGRTVLDGGDKAGFDCSFEDEGRLSSFVKGRSGCRWNSKENPEPVAALSLLGDWSGLGEGFGIS